MTKILEQGLYGIDLFEDGGGYDVLVDVFQNEPSIPEIGNLWEVLIKSQSGEVREQWIGEDGEEPTKDIVNDLMWDYMTTFYGHFDSYSTKLEKFADEESDIVFDLELQRDVTIADSALKKKLAKLFPDVLEEDKEYER